MSVYNLSSSIPTYRDKALLVIIALYTIQKEETRFMIEVNTLVKSY